VAIYRAQISWGADTAFPRDRVTINPHFKVTISPNPQQLADDLAAAIAGWQQPSPTGREVQVKMYDAEDPPPSPPVAQKMLNSGIVPVSPGPREIAVCLSFYAQTNTPSRRGRLFVPLFVANGNAPSGPTVSSVNRDAIATLVPIFASLGGVDTDWVVWSRKNEQAHTVTNWFVDDEYDTVRSRGLRPTLRKTGTTSG
jgi:hypothetical protein